MREQSHREKAIEFAKQVPKPKPKKDESLNQIQEEEFDEMGNTIGMTETNREQIKLLDIKNRVFANELDKIKELFE